DNTCGQTGSGNNDASCVFEGIDNFIDPIVQGNLVSNADDGTVISQDNRAVISQVNVGENDCDENTFTDTHDNNADCLIGGLLNNFLGPIDQVNEIVDAQDNSISNQDNNVAVSQDLLTENDCNGTGGNDVQCTNDGFEDGIDIFDFNFIAEIDQFNDAILTGDVSSAQVNDVALAQTGALVNTCDETGGGVNVATCENDEVKSLVGPITQSNAEDAPNSDTASQTNGAQVTQNAQAVNDCDEEGTGFNFAFCENAGDDFNEVANNFVDSISQQNGATVGDDLVQFSFVGINQDLQLENVCDETGVGDSDGICTNSLDIAGFNNFIGPVSQQNNVLGEGDADFRQNNNIPTINQVLVAENDCDQSDEQSAQGDNSAICTNNDVRNTFSSIIQKNSAFGTHVDDIFQDNTGAFSQVMTLNNGCDATTFSSSGDNDATCTNDFVQNFIGPVEQVNQPVGLDDVLIDEDNNVAVSQVLSANNDCDATALNDVVCDNFGTNSINSITQTNIATADDFASISQNNDATIVQNLDLLNSCDESGDGINTVSCEYNAQNFIGPVTQINFANDANQIDTVVQSNVAQVSQNLQGVNDCDEENTGFNDVACENNDQGIFNSINQITQTNDAALVGDDTVQSNFIGVNQDSQTENVCDETGLGDNDAFCINPEIDNTLGPVIQLNDADGSGDADFTQNNNIPIVNQVAEAENDCDQSDEQGAEGDNDAEVCQIFARNLIDSLSQTNDAEGTHVDDIFQDNQGAFSQVMTLNNDCDATTFSTSGDNLVRCITNGGNTIDEPVSQTNTATGLDDVLIDQDNNVAVFQDLSANNDCDATASNIADCTNVVQNFVDLVTQTNTATGDGFADISQTNNAPINQLMDLLNSCGESGDGNNLAQCSNDAGNLIGPVRQTNTATGADNSVIRQFNVASITQNMEGTNDCDEANTGFNNVQCTTNISNNIESITQSNEVTSATGSQVHDQSNVLGITQNLVATNDCDESGLGDNNAICSITASNDIGAISQSNTASSNVLNINQDGQATNNCDDTTSGDNTAQCSINLHLVVPDIAQLGDETLNIDQHENLVNSCPGTGLCSISITRTFDPLAIQSLLASTTTASASTTDSNADEEDEEETGSQA
ncbi:MAG TPA: hypothetical protein VL854_14050, partial [Nitrososphaeraceae archaeon]|nr:hypothetical protein [Nitrososphaeraceae archaeon]